MTEIEEMPNPKATTIIPDRCIWVCLYWIKDCSWPSTTFGQDKAQVITWATDNSFRDPDRPLKLYRLDY